MFQSLFIFLVCFSFSLIAATDQECANRIYAHLTINDCDSACVEAESTIKQHPNSKLLWEATIQALSKKGESREILKAWNNYVTRFPDQQHNRHILESMAWGVIEKRRHSSSPLIRTIATVAACLCNDSKGVAIIQKSLRDPNAHVRGTAVKMASQMRDAKLQDEIVRLFDTEQDFEIRLEVIKAIGSMDIKQARPKLVEIISNSRVHAIEKAAAIQSIVTMLETAHRNQVMTLARSNRSGLRELACQVVAHFDLHRDLDLIVPLLQDHNPDVRKSALQTLGVLRAKDYNQQVLQLIHDPDPEVRIAAAWVTLLNDQNKGQQAIRELFNHSSREIRLKTAAALVASGKYSGNLILERMRESDDAIERLNLALGCVYQRLKTDIATREIHKAFLTNQEKWMWKQDGVFRYLAPNNSLLNGSIENPEVVNQLTRLEVLNVLAIMKVPEAQNSLRHFVTHNQFWLKRSWGATAAVSALLLTEGDDEAVDLVFSLLNDPNQKIRIQAALILAIWGQDERAITTLKEAYVTADRNLKESILEGIGKIGSKESIPFLVEKLNESAPTLKIIAAFALIQCLYH